jgi:hypothetical protein
MKYSTIQFLYVQLIAAAVLFACLFFADTTSIKSLLYVPATLALVVALGSGYEFVREYKKRLQREG